MIKKEIDFCLLLLINLLGLLLLLLLILFLLLLLLLLSKKTHTFMKGHTSTVWDLSFDKEGNRFLSASSDKSIRLFIIIIIYYYYFYYLLYD